MGYKLLYFAPGDFFAVSISFNKLLKKALRNVCYFRELNIQLNRRKIGGLRMTNTENNGWIYFIINWPKVSKICSLPFRSYNLLKKIRLICRAHDEAFR